MKSLLRLGLVAFTLLFASQAQAANRFAVCTVTCTWDGSSTAMWSTSTGGATGASVPGSSDTAIFDGATCVGGVTCTITTNTNPSITSITFSACTASTAGCILDFSANNNFATLSGGITSTGSGTRTLKCGTNTWIFTGTAPVTYNGATNFTNTCTAATFSFRPVSLAAPDVLLLDANDATLPTLDFQSPSAGSQAYVFQIAPITAATIAGLSGVNSPFIAITTNTTLTITNAPALSGTLAAPLTLSNSNPVVTTQATVTTPAGFTCSYCAFVNINLTNAPTVSFANSWNLSRNTNVNVTAPSGGGGGHIIGG
jgi:hypothetical protein